MQGVLVQNNTHTKEYLQIIDYYYIYIYIYINDYICSFQPFLSIFWGPILFINRFRIGVFSPEDSFIRIISNVLF